MSPVRFDRLLLTVLVASLALVPAFAQNAPPPPPQPAQPASAPVDGRETIAAIVIEVQGEVESAPLDSRDWTPVKVDDQLPPETKIRTGVRSSVKLKLGEEEPYSVLVVESVGLTVLSELYKTSDTKHVRVGVGYGQVRAGVAEGGLKSDFTVDSPVATLSKRGTWNFGMFYERGTDRFEVFLLDRGLVDVLNKMTAQRARLSPREFVTQAMRIWADQSQLVRNVPVPDILGQSDLDIAFNRLENDGLGVVNTNQGRAVLINLNNASARQNFADLVNRQLGSNLGNNIDLNGNRAIVRPEGFFGTGRGDQLINVIIDDSNDLVQQGLAQPGKYKFRRSALESWMKNNKRN